MDRQKTDEVETDVLAAFLNARNFGCPLIDCYSAGVNAWQRRYPDHARSYAAHKAVAVILAYLYRGLEPRRRSERPALKV